MRMYPRVLAFYSWRDYPSNFFLSDFRHSGLTFDCVERFYMFHKARFFSDEVRMYQIMDAPNAMACKRLGRQVKKFDDARWKEVCQAVMLAGVMSKFRQNNALAERLMSTYPKRLVEASPRDKYWGAGLDQADPLIADPANWVGENNLGKVLETVRDRLLLARDGPFVP